MKATPPFLTVTDLPLVKYRSTLRQKKKRVVAEKKKNVGSIEEVR